MSNTVIQIMFPLTLESRFPPHSLYSVDRVPMPHSSEAINPAYYITYR